MSSSDVAESANSSIAEILAKLRTDPETGLDSAQLQERLSKYGPNALPEEKKSALAAFLAYFWGPIPWMIEAAALVAPKRRNKSIVPLALKALAKQQLARVGLPDFHA